MSVFVCSASRSLLIKSSPESLGIQISASIISGPKVFAILSASTPFFALPTIFNPRSKDISISANPSLIIGSSSAINTFFILTSGLFYSSSFKISKVATVYPFSSFE